MGVRGAAVGALVAAGVVEIVFALRVRDATGLPEAGMPLVAASIGHLFFAFWVAGSSRVGPWLALAFSLIVTGGALAAFVPQILGPWPVAWFWLPLMATVTLGVVAVWALALQLATAPRQRRNAFKGPAPS